MLKNLSNLADKAISDDELENVSGGAGVTYPKACSACRITFSWTEGSGPCVCPQCGKPC